MENVLIQLRLQLVSLLDIFERTKKNTNSSILKKTKNKEGVKHEQLSCSRHTMYKARHLLCCGSSLWGRVDQDTKAFRSAMCGKRGWSGPSGLMKEEYEKRRDTEELNMKENRAVFPDLDKSKVSDWAEGSFLWCSVWLAVISFKMFDCVTTPCKN